MNIYVYGPPLSGKSTISRMLAERLDLPFLDLDIEIETHAQQSIPQIFETEGESGFRQRELGALRLAAGNRAPQVIALGGGALVHPAAREVAEKSGKILCLNAALETLLERMDPEEADRPLLARNPAERLASLLQSRKEHYQSFSLQLSTDGCPVEDLVWKAQIILGSFRVRGMGQAYDVRISPGGIRSVGSFCTERDLKGPIAVVTDEHVGALWGNDLLQGLKEAGYTASLYAVPPGEENKNIQTILKIWDYFLSAGIERSSTVIALGGGVVGDMTGFAAATFLRGVSWVNVPTTLLSMVDSSLGGKTGIDLPQAKNLVGAFHPPRFVLADPQVLESLPVRELRGGLAEVVKHGVIADADLFDLCSMGLDEITNNLTRLVSQAMAVKVKVIEVDPFEKGLRQSLNLGHTIGHGVETASGFSLNHGESVAIGMVAEARAAEQLGLAEPGLSRQIADVLSGIGLPIEIPEDIPFDRVIQAVQLDKKRSAGKVHFALPQAIGKVLTGVVVDDWQQMMLNSAAARRTL